MLPIPDFVGAIIIHIFFLKIMLVGECRLLCTEVSIDVNLVTGF